MLAMDTNRADMGSMFMILGDEKKCIFLSAQGLSGRKCLCFGWILNRRKALVTTVDQLTEIGSSVRMRYCHSALHGPGGH